MTAYVEPSDSVRRVVEGVLDKMGSHQRVLVVGGPRVGKSTLSELAGDRLGVRPHHTDDTIGLGWSGASAEVAQWFDRPGPWIIEGVALPRALRKWLLAHPEGKPCDLIFWSNRSKVARNEGQRTMAKGVETVWVQILAELRSRGVAVTGF